MDILSSVLALTFILRLRFGRTATVQDVIHRNHGQETLSGFRRFFDANKKKAKCELDLEFLVKCKTYEIFPKFLRFKLHKKCLHNKKFYKSWQTKLLNEEIKCKRLRINDLSVKIQNGTDFLKILGGQWHPLHPRFRRPCCVGRPLGIV